MNLTATVFDIRCRQIKKKNMADGEDEPKFKVDQ